MASRERSPRIESYEARTILTPTCGFLAGSGGFRGFTHTLNPAVGCVYGRGLCGQYCYARLGLAVRFGASASAEWGSLLRVKRNAAEMLERELARAARRVDAEGRGPAPLRVFASSSTDPCAGPALAVFADCLAVFARHPVERLVIQTRAPSIERLRDRVAALREQVVLSLTLETDDSELDRHAPRGSPSVTARRALIKRLRAWGVALHVAVSPCLPLRDPQRFADWIAANADYATVDTLVCGDGSGTGARSRRTPLPLLAARLGFEWQDEEPARRLFAALRQRMGERAGWSANGFARLAEPLERTVRGPA